MTGKKGGIVVAFYGVPPERVSHSLTSVRRAMLSSGSGAAAQIVRVLSALGQGHASPVATPPFTLDTKVALVAKPVFNSVGCVPQQLYRSSDVLC